MRLDSALKKSSPIYLGPKFLDTFWCTGWVWYCQIIFRCASIHGRAGFILKLMFLSFRHRWPLPILAILFRTFCFLPPIDFQIIYLSNILAFSVPGEEFHRNTSCVLNLIPMFLQSPIQSCRCLQALYLYHFEFFQPLKSCQILRWIFLQSGS
jgi:hypothetical protein